MPDVLVALRVFPRYRMLMLTLERMGLTRAATYATAARLASRLAALDRARRGGGRGAVPGRARAAAADGRGRDHRRLEGRGAPHRRHARAAQCRRLVCGRHRALVEPEAPAGDRSGRHARSGARRCAVRSVRGLPPGPASTGKDSSTASTSAPRNAGASKGCARRQAGLPIDAALQMADLAQELASASVTLAQVESVGRRAAVIADMFLSTGDVADAMPALAVEHRCPHPDARRREPGDWRPGPNRRRPRARSRQAIRRRTRRGRRRDLGRGADVARLCDEPRRSATARSSWRATSRGATTSASTPTTRRRGCSGRGRCRSESSRWACRGTSKARCSASTWRWPRSGCTSCGPIARSKSRRWRSTSAKPSRPATR